MASGPGNTQATFLHTAKEGEGKRKNWPAYVTSEMIFCVSHENLVGKVPTKKVNKNVKLSSNIWQKKLNMCTPKFWVKLCGISVCSMVITCSVVGKTKPFVKQNCQERALLFRQHLITFQSRVCSTVLQGETGHMKDHYFVSKISPKKKKKGNKKRKWFWLHVDRLKVAAPLWDALEPEAFKHTDYM